MLRTILLLYSLGRLCVTVLQTTGSMGCVLHTVLAVSLSVYVIVTMLQCWVLLLYSLHRVCVTVLQTILAAWAVSCQCVLNCYSVANYTGCMGCILSVCVLYLYVGEHIKPNSQVGRHVLFSNDHPCSTSNISITWVTSLAFSI